MKEYELIKIIIRALEQEKLLICYRLYQGSRAVRLITSDGTVFNILPLRISKDRKPDILLKNRENGVD